MSKSTKFFLVITSLIILAMATRFLFLIDGSSVLPNFSAVGAVAIVGAIYFRGIYRFIVPFLILWLSDLILNNGFYSQYYDGFQLFGDSFVYLGFLAIAAVAYLIMKKSSWTGLVITGLTGAVAFYLITNLGVWITSGMYTKDLSGLLASYEAGIPFFRNTLLGNLFYSFILVGLFEFGIAKWMNLEEHKAFAPVA